MAPELLTVIVSTYERARELRLVLEGLARQREAPPFEVKVCDDGSGRSTAEAVEDFRVAHPEVDLEHCRHEDDGFRAAAARNLGLRVAKGDYVVFLDGDCIPFEDFLARHAALAAPGRFFVGERHFLDKDPCDALTPADVAAGRHEELPTREELRRVRKSARKIKLYSVTGIKKGRPKLITANAAAWRSDLEAVNGLDERYVGWGHEDDDLGRRLMRHGIRPGSAFDVARCAHLWHPPQASFAGRVRDCPNEPYFSRGFYLARCTRGLIPREWSDFASAIDPVRDPIASTLTSVLTERFSAPIPGVLGPESCGPEGLDLSFVVVGTPASGAPRPRFLDAAQVRILITVPPGAASTETDRDRHARAVDALARKADLLVTLAEPGVVDPLRDRVRLPDKVIRLVLDDRARSDDGRPSADAVARALEAIRDVV